MKYTAVSVFCLALAGIIVIYQFRPTTHKTPITERKITPIQKEYTFKPTTNNNIIRPVPKTQENNTLVQKQNVRDIKNNNVNHTVQTKNLPPQKTTDNTIEFAKKLRTTYVDGIYCQQVADDGTYKKQKHYFYNQKTEQFVEIPNVYFINNLETLGDLKDEFLQYGAKTDTITYKGQRIKIWTMK